MPVVFDYKANEKNRFASSSITKGLKTQQLSNNDGLIGIVAEVGDEANTKRALRFVSSNNDKVAATIDIVNDVSKENKKSQALKIKYVSD